MRNVLKTLDVLAAVSEHQPVGVGELSRWLSLPKSTVQRALLTLHEGGWIRATGGEPRKWMLTTKPLVVGMRATVIGGIRDAALPIMHRIRAETNETTNLTVLEGKFAILLERLDSTHPVRTFAPLGVQAPLHASAAGRAILSRMPEDAMKQALSGQLKRYTSQTRTAVNDVLKQIAASRNRGYGIAASEWNQGVVAVAAAIVVSSVEFLGRPGGVLGTIGVSGPEHRMPKKRLHELGPMLVEAADEIASVIEGSARSAEYQ